MSRFRTTLLAVAFISVTRTIIACCIAFIRAAKAIKPVYTPKHSIAATTSNAYVTNTSLAAFLVANITVPAQLTSIVTATASKFTTSCPVWKAVHVAYSRAIQIIVTSNACCVVTITIIFITVHQAFTIRYTSVAAELITIWSPSSISTRNAVSTCTLTGFASGVFTFSVTIFPIKSVDAV